MVKLGECDLIEEIFIGEDRLIQFSGCASGQACTVVLRGASTHVLEEAERSLHDALCVLCRTVSITKTIPGGGCTEMAMAEAIEKEVPTVAGKSSLAMEVSLWGRGVSLHVASGLFFSCGCAVIRCGRMWYTRHRRRSPVLCAPCRPSSRTTLGTTRRSW